MNDSSNPGGWGARAAQRGGRVAAAAGIGAAGLGASGVTVWAAAGNGPWWAAAGLATLTAIGLALQAIPHVLHALVPQDSPDRLEWWRDVLAYRTRCRRDRDKARNQRRQTRRWKRPPHQASNPPYPRTIAAAAPTPRSPAPISGVAAIGDR
jgi:hypothetical protein